MTEKEDKQQLDKLLNSNYDGIEEYDNDLPLWWVNLFYITIILSAIYVIYFHVVPGINPKEELAQALQQLQSAKIAAGGNAESAVSAELLVSLVSDAAVVAKGKEVFMARCVACHGVSGGGIVGPNLTDKFWVHGGGILDLHRVINEGVLNKGMLAWKGVIPESEIQAVTAFLWTLRDTNVPGGKGPEGSPVE